MSINPSFQTARRQFPTLNKFSALWIVLFFANLTGFAQTDIKEVNALLDQAVVNKDLVFLNRHYADDFVFTHGTGQVDSKTSWIDFVARENTRFLLRKHDSVAVELHAELAIVTGSMEVQREATPKNKNYGIRYVRVYRQRGTIWQLISHRTVKEWGSF